MRGSEGLFNCSADCQAFHLVMAMSLSPSPEEAVLYTF
jgi:hypothetical protein